MQFTVPDTFVCSQMQFTVPDTFVCSPPCGIELVQCSRHSNLITRRLTCSGSPSFRGS
ncbi:MAG: hypothetical protein JWN70_3419 [Planctomycetaceae bacterium]|nr:hypothetical protein [Planctomycetaceae bacterium]